MLQETWLLLRKSKDEKGTSLQLRLFAFFGLFVVILALAFVLILLGTGVFGAGEKESLRWMENEMAHLAEGVDTHFGRLSLQGTSMAEQLTRDTDLWLVEHELSVQELQDNPSLLEDLMSKQSAAVVSALESNQCSGSFLVLDATVNPALDGSEFSRAGIFLKRTEPNAVNLVGSKIHYLRGPSSIARRLGIELLGQWKMEFDVTAADYFEITMDTARENSRLALSRLYYWNKRVRLKGNSESGMLLCLPLISRDKTVYGICGLEVSSMLFKLNYSPDNSRYPGIFCTLSPLEENVLDSDWGLVGGNSYLTNPETGRFQVSTDTHTGVSTFQSNSGATYVGLLQPIKLYPAASPYQQKTWVLALMMPQQEWASAAQGNSRILYGAILVLLALSLLAALFVSKRYIRPVVEALNMVKGDSHTALSKTNILEIDDLLEYLSAQDEQREALGAELEKAREKLRPLEACCAESALPDLTAYQSFVRNIDTLSAAERAVFNLYLKGYTAKEIAGQLCLSMNTIKTHNKRIYTKLDVSSRKELMVYVQMMTSERTKEEV